MEEAVEDAANDPTLHTVSNSWGYGGEAEWGTNDPFRLATETSFAFAAAAGTTFWFSTGDSRHVLVRLSGRQPVRRLGGWHLAVLHR